MFNGASDGSVVCLQLSLGSLFCGACSIGVGRSVRIHRHRSVRRVQPVGLRVGEEVEGEEVVVELDNKREGSKEHKLRDREPAWELASERGTG